VPAGEAELVVEVTSKSNANHDRIKKAHGYAVAGVPLYLLLDAWQSGRPTATLYGEPQSGTYRVLSSVEYGEELTLPAPFELALDTGIFPLN
jgi:Uma2 family endonuclease